ncbi:MAG: Rossmann-like and DUF2520 domain-containing protein [Longimicrobiales bacterium]
MKERLAFFGPGRAGLSFGYALWQTGQVASLTYFGRRSEPPSHPLFTQGLAEYVFGVDRPAEGTTALVLSVPDDALSEMAQAVAARGMAPQGCSAFHLSGSLSTEALAPLHARGYAVGSLHPLVTIAHPVTGADRLTEAVFAISGEAEAVARGRALVHLIGASPIQIPVRARPSYHAAAVMASNYVAVVFLAAARILTRTGLTEQESLSALLPLAKGTLEDLEGVGGLRALVGPVVRGDRETIALHLRSLEGPDRELYGELGRELVRVCIDEGLDQDRADEILEVLRTT